MTTRRAAITLAVVAALLVLSGCRVDVTTSVTVAEDGSGTVRVEAVADAAIVQAAPGLAEELRTDDLVDAGWTVEGPTPTDDGGLAVVLTHDFTGPEEANALLAQINGKAGPYRDLTVTRTITDDALTIQVDGEVGLRGGLRAFADQDLVDLVGDVPWRQQLADSDIPIGDALRAELLVALPDEDGDATSATVGSDGTTEATRYTLAADGAPVTVDDRTVIDLTPDERAPVVATIATVALVVWLVGSIAFAVYVLVTRRRRRLARLRALGR